MLPPSPPASALADSALQFLIQVPAKVHVFGEWKGNPKHPLAKGGFSTATNDSDEIERRCANPAATGYCVYPGAGLMVIDLDVGDGKDGRKELGKLAAEHGEKLPQTACVKSPRGNGSQHLYFRVPKDVVIPSSNGKIAPGIDVRGNDGAYWIAGPGSRTAKGEYKWERGPEHIIDAPEWLIEAAIAARPRVRERSKPKTLPQCVTWDYPPNIERFTAWLKNEAKLSIEGQGGNGTLAATGAMGSSYALYEETTIQLMAEHWNERCKPPWDDDDLEYHGGSGYRSAEHLGNMAARDYSTLFKPNPRLAWNDGECVDWEDRNPPSEKELAELEREREKALIPPSLIEHMQATLGNDVGSLPAIPLYDLDELASLPAPEWDMEGLIGRAKLGIIVGKWGHYKTFLALDMAVALAGQIPWPAIADKGCKQYAVPKPRRVLYIAAEGGAAEYHQRLEATLGNRKEIDRDQVKRNFVLATASAPLDTTAGQCAIADAIERATEKMGGAPEVIFCDTLAKSMAGEENSNTDMGKVQGVAAAIQRTLQCSFIFVHHTGKDGEKSGRGASSMPAGLDFLFHVIGEETTKVATVNVEKQRDAPEEKNIILQGRAVNNSLAFARIAKAPSKKADQEITGLMHRLGQIIEDGGGKAFSTQGLAKQLAREADDSFESMGADKQKGQIEKMRGLIRRNIIDAKTPEAKDFHERYRMGTGANIKWTYKDAAND